MEVWTNNKGSSRVWSAMHCRVASPSWYKCRVWCCIATCATASTYISYLAGGNVWNGVTPDMNSSGAWLAIRCTLETFSDVRARRRLKVLTTRYATDMADDVACHPAQGDFQLSHESHGDNLKVFESLRCSWESAAGTQLTNVVTSMLQPSYMVSRRHTL